MTLEAYSARFPTQSGQDYQNPLSVVATRHFAAVYKVYSIRLLARVQQNQCLRAGLVPPCRALFQNAPAQSQEAETQEITQESLSETVSSPMETPEVLNQELLWERVGRASGILRTLVALCKVQYPLLIAEMRDTLQSSDIPAFQKAAHQFRGMMMSIYVTAATEAVRRYELAVKEKNCVAIVSADAALDAEILRLEFALDRLLSETGE